MKSAGLLGAMANCPAARAYDGSGGYVGVIDHGMPYYVSKIELTVAVCIGTWKLEEGSCRGVQLIRLGCRGVSTGPFEPELEPQLLNAGKCRS